MLKLRFEKKEISLSTTVPLVESEFTYLKQKKKKFITSEINAAHASNIHNNNQQQGSLR